MTMIEMESRLASLETEVARLKDELEHTKTLAAIERGISQMKRGEGIPAREAFDKLRQKYGIPT